MGEYLPEPAIERGPMPIDKALLFASNMKLCRREQDFALLALADEVRRLRGEQSRVATIDLGKFVSVQATVEEALAIHAHYRKLRDDIKARCNYQDDTLDVCNDILATEVIRLRGELERLVNAAGDLGEFILEGAG